MSADEFEVKNLKKLYGKQVALNDVSFSVKAGSMNFLLGANGSGKSTLMRCLAGHERWTAGDLLRQGQSRGDDRKNFNHGLHLISEDIMPPLVSLGELRSLYQEIYGTWDEALFQQILTWGGLELTQSLSGVSRGQKMQGLLALTLATRPQTLLIDEATAVLDPFMRNRLVLEIERQHRENGMTVLIATNIVTELAGLPGRLLIMKKGRVACDREPDRVSEGFVKVRVDAGDIETLPSAGFSFVEKNDDGSWSFLGLESDLAKIEVPYRADKRAISVDEIFIYFSDRRPA